LRRINIEGRWLIDALLEGNLTVPALASVTMKAILWTLTGGR
jgi:hypothetical protein